MLVVLPCSLWAGQAVRGAMTAKPDRLAVLQAITLQQLALQREQALLCRQAQEEEPVHPVWQIPGEVLVVQDTRDSEAVLAVMQELLELLAVVAAVELLR